MRRSGGARLVRAMVCAVALAAPATAAWAEESGSGSVGRPLAVGVQLDLFPTIVSAANGKLGYAPQIWIGIDHLRLRLIGAHLEPPDAFAFDDDFEDPTSTVLAAVVDYTFGERFDGWWLSGGFEVWERTVRHEGSRDELAWTSIIGTIGGGYIWRFAGDFYVDPWLGVHATLNPETIEGAGFEYEPPAVVANASVKIGWFSAW
ncbi:MAG: hypothetical protein U0610_06170 [bacterium]